MADKAFFTTPFGTSVSFAAADTTTPKVVQAFPAAGGRLFSLSFTNSSGVAQIMQIFRRVASNNFLLCEVDVPVGAGIAGASPREAVAPQYFPCLASMPALLDGIPFGASQEIWCASKTTIASGAVTVSKVSGQG
ncbi:MAG: hypothetical protein ING73_11210 [Rhodocyclaceae bacterium]|nr:hypothetical protein [Rhodocyclaceae bacterium]